MSSGRFLRRGGLLLLVPLACAGARLGGEQQQHPVLVATPITVGEAEPRAETPEPSATAPTATAVPERASEAPDPRPLAEREHWEYELVFHEGEVQVRSVSLRTFERPVVTARHHGRFAVELWIGRELVERVRFDFPLLGAEVPPTERQGIHEQPRFEPGLHAVRTVLVPNARRAVRAQLVDRATGETTLLPWPPDAPLDPIVPIIPAAENADGPAGSTPIPE